MCPLHRTATESREIWLRRTGFAVLVAVTLAAASVQWYRVLLLNGFHALEWVMFPLLTVLLLPIVILFWTVVFGFVVQMRSKDELAIGNGRDRSLSGLELDSFRTAVVIPVYNEETARVYAGLKATYESVEQTGKLAHFDFYLLSDTTDPDAWVREEVAVAGLRRELGDPGRLFYRNRRENVDRKAGNIADFCARWGKRYRYMIVLDADSIMTGQTLVQLVHLMERHPGAGIIQTPLLTVQRQSLFGRVLQFAIHVYSPTYLRGLNYWQAGEGNYWGHNAIIRVEPFVEHCRLPRLPGKAPLGGAILSHDFVEAALMRKAGWQVYLAGDLRGSFEGMPGNLIGYAARDRRWCQGNLQHLRLLGSPGLHWISRLNLLLGVMAYVSSPLWMLLLLLNTAEGLRSVWVGHQYFAPARSAFPIWEVSTQREAVALFAAVMSFLILPKLLSLAAIFLRHRWRVSGYGGALRLGASVLAEILFSVLIAPVLAMLHSRFVIGTLMGRNVEWAAQVRGDEETLWREAVRRHLGITLLGTLWGALLFWESRELFWWFLPVLAGLVFSIPLSVWSSRVRWGRFARRWGLFLTPEEVRAPRILRRYRKHLRRAGKRVWAKSNDGLGWVLRNAEIRSIHLSFLERSSHPHDPLIRNRLEGLRLRWGLQGEGALLPQEKRDLLLDAGSIRVLAQDGDGHGNGDGNRALTQ